MYKNARRLSQMCISFSKHYILREKRKLYFQIYRGKKDSSKLSTLFVPVPVKSNPDDINVGAELTGKLNKSDVMKILNKFYQKKEIKSLAMENGLDSKYIF